MIIGECCIWFVSREFGSQEKKND